jgi:hypothetical protein
MSAPRDNLPPDEARILDSATDVPFNYQPENNQPLSNQWYWRIIDRIGMACLWLACALTAFVIISTTLGGSAWDWTANFFMLILPLLIIWLLGYIRASRRDNQLKATLKQAEYDRRRAELARMVIEQAKKDQDKQL